MDWQRSAHRFLLDFGGEPPSNSCQPDPTKPPPPKFLRGFLLLGTYTNPRLRLAAPRFGKVLHLSSLGIAIGCTNPWYGDIPPYQTGSACPQAARALIKNPWVQTFFSNEKQHCSHKNWINLELRPTSVSNKLDAIWKKI